MNRNPRIALVCMVVPLCLAIGDRSIVHAADAATSTPPADSAAPLPAKLPAKLPAAAPTHGLIDPAKPIDTASIYQLESRWTRADGEKIALSALRGKVRVVTIFYSSCEYACPIIVGRMKSVQEAIPDGKREDVGFVLISMDCRYR